jgi:probable DNA repair protein
MRPSSRLPPELIEEPEAGVLVTPNRRLAAALKYQFDQTQIAAGKQAWVAATILPIGTYFEQLFRSFSARTDQPQRWQLIDASQSQLLWEQVVRKSSGEAPLLSVPAAARQAGDAWKVMHDWQLQNAMRGAQLHEDGVVFMRWAARYHQLLRERKLLDQATLPTWLVDTLNAQRMNGMVGSPLRPNLFAIGFDIVPPQLRRLFDAFAGLGVTVRELDGIASETSVCERVEFNTERDELFACAEWAGRQLREEPTRRIGVVVPTLRTKRSMVHRVFMDTFAPAVRGGIADASARQHADAIFNISLGEPMIDYPLVRDAMGLIELSAGRAMLYGEVSRLLRSPFLRGANKEFSSRAQLDAMLRESAPDQVDLGWLDRKVQSAADSPLQSAAAAAGTLSRMIHEAESVSQQFRLSSAVLPPAEWAQRFSGWLTLWGFPGDTPLDSVRYQVLSKFHTALQQLAAFQLVVPRMRIDDALCGLRRILADTVFQPETDAGRPPPIQILGVLESAGQTFDALWVTGLCDAEWPLPTRPNPFIPAALQRGAGVPEASADASLRLDRRITHSWENAANQVVFSHARHAHNTAEAPRQVSPLISHVALRAQSTPSSKSYAAALFEANSDRAMETIVDTALAPLSMPTEVAGGAALIRDQAACPFRAMARHRLGAKKLSLAGTDLDSAERGTLLHRVLSLTWMRIRSLESLVSLSAANCREIVEAAAERAITESQARGVESLTGRFAKMEQARLTDLVMAWLDIERERGPFEVEACEEKKSVAIGALRLSLRLDRIDRLADGTRLLIDYKTGMANAKSWLGERPDDPQLPLYWRTADGSVGAVAFARLKRGAAFGFDGVSAEDTGTPNVAPVQQRRVMADAGVDSWPSLEQHWARSIDGLVEQFERGVATVDPKHGGLTCQQCDLHLVCRVAEYAGRGGAGDTDDAMADDAGGDNAGGGDV